MLNKNADERETESKISVAYPDSTAVHLDLEPNLGLQQGECGANLRINRLDIDALSTCGDHGIGMYQSKCDFKKKSQLCKNSNNIMLQTSGLKSERQISIREKKVIRLIIVENRFRNSVL